MCGFVRPTFLWVFCDAAAVCVRPAEFRSIFFYLLLLIFYWAISLKLNLSRLYVNDMGDIVLVMLSKLETESIEWNKKRRLEAQSDKDDNEHSISWPTGGWAILIFFVIFPLNFSYKPEV